MEEPNNISNLGEIVISYKYKSKLSDRPKICSSKEAADIAFKLIDNSQVGVMEHFIIIFMNNANKVIGTYKGFSGGLNYCFVDIRLLIAMVLNLLSTSIIIIHNHPSGNLIPSNADINLTNKIKKALALIDVKLIDHIIISPENTYYSFANDGVLNEN